MIAHDPRRWIEPVFTFHRTDTFRNLLPLLILVVLFTSGVVLIEDHYGHFFADRPIKNITLMHTLLGFAISMLLVFRTNTAYDRWWEGRKLYGALVNNSRNLAVKLNTFLPAEDGENRRFFAETISLFAVQLSHHLIREETRLALDESPHPELGDLDRSAHVPAQVVSRLWSKLRELEGAGKLTSSQLWLSNGEVSSFLDICGACERIKNTPIPYSYHAFIKKFIVVYTITLPFGYVVSLGWYAVPVVAFVFYVLASLELIAEEIEDPFGKDSNDLPLLKISENIGRSVRYLLELRPTAATVQV